MSMTHVPDCVSLLETNELTSPENIKRLSFVYGHKNKTYKLRIPVNLIKDERSPICSAIINEENDITEYVLSLDGPFHNFYMQPLTVRDIIHPALRDSFKVLEVVESNLRIHTHTSLDDKITFHYSHEWPRYNKSLAMETYNLLSYLDLAA